MSNLALPIYCWLLFASCDKSNFVFETSRLHFSMPPLLRAVILETFLNPYCSSREALPRYILFFRLPNLFSSPPCCAICSMNSIQVQLRSLLQSTKYLRGFHLRSNCTGCRSRSRNYSREPGRPTLSIPLSMQYDRWACEENLPT